MSDIEIKEISDYFHNILKVLYKDFGKPKCIGLYTDESCNSLKLSFNLKEKYVHGKTNYSTMECIDYAEFKSNTNNISGHWVGILFRQLTKFFDLPTVFHFEEATRKNNRILIDEVEILGRWVVNTFRDSIYKTHLNQKHNLLASLDEKQQAIVDEYILTLIDGHAFNFGKFIDEEVCFDHSIQITVNGKTCNEITLDLMGNGNFSGEYFDWVPRFSEFEEVRY